MPQIYHLGNPEDPKKYACEIPDPKLNGYLSETDSKVNDSVKFLSKNGFVKAVHFVEVRFFRPPSKMKFMDCVFIDCHFSREFCDQVEFDGCAFHECKFESSRVIGTENLFDRTVLSSCIIDPVVCKFNYCLIDDCQFSEKVVSSSFYMNLWTTKCQYVTEIMNNLGIPLVVYRHFIQIGSREFSISEEGLVDFDVMTLSQVEKKAVILYDYDIRRVLEEKCNVDIQSPLHESRK